jgi:hypothetical protein
MPRRSTSVAFAVVITMTLPVGTALAQGAAPAGTVSTTGIGNASGVPAGTTGIGNASSINSGSINSGSINPGPGGTPAAPPPLTAQSAPPAPVAVQGFAEQEQISPTGRAVPGPDGVSTRIVAARPCSRSARETDGITTCVGIPATQEASYSGRRSRHRRS